MDNSAKPSFLEAETGEVNHGSAQIHYTIQRTERKTLAITVMPDGEVLVKVPISSPANQIAERIKRRAGWILRQQDRFNRLKLQAMPARRYISGETHYYLGRQYRLKIEEDKSNRVLFRAGRIVVSRLDKRDRFGIAQQLKAWYRQRAQSIIIPLYNHCLAKLPIEESRKINIQIRLVQMDRRWGSCSRTGIIRLNPDLVRTPKACIEYIVWHELAHLVEPNHSKSFYALQDRLMPDWKVWQERLRYFNPE